MKSGEIARSLEKIEPQGGAKQRMYGNILEKAGKTRKRPTAAKLLRIAAPIAACLCVVVIGALIVKNSQPGTVMPPVLGQSPYEQVDSAADFLKLGIDIDAPPDSQSAQYAIIDGSIANIEFLYGEYSYTVMASEQSGDFSGIFGETLSAESLGSKFGGLLERVDCSGDIYHKISWSSGKINYILWSSSAPEQAVISVYNTIISDMQE